MSGKYKTIPFHQGEVAMKCSLCGHQSEFFVDHIIWNDGMVEHAYVCKKCGYIVPESSMQGYLKTGTVVINHKPKRKEK